MIHWVRSTSCLYIPSPSLSLYELALSLYLGLYADELLIGFEIVFLLRMKVEHTTSVCDKGNLGGTGLSGMVIPAGPG